MTRLSNSSINTYLDCPHKYKLDKVDRIRPTWKSSSLLFGSAIDAAMEAILLKEGEPAGVFMENMLKTDINEKEVEVLMTSNVRYTNGDIQLELLEDSDLIKIKNYASELELKISEDYTISHFVDYYKDNKKKADKEEHLLFSSIGWSCLLRKGMMMIPVLQKWAEENVAEVHDIQRKINIENEDGDYITGYLDFIVTLKDGRKVLMDLKTSSDAKKYYPDGCVEESQQLNIYAEDVGLEDAGYLVVDKKIRKREPRVRLREVYGKINEKSLDKVFDKVEEVLYNIKEEKFEKNRDSCFNFGGCQYYSLCHHGSMKGLTKVKERDGK